MVSPGGPLFGTTLCTLLEADYAGSAAETAVRLLTVELSIREVPHPRSNSGWQHLPG